MRTFFSALLLIAIAAATPFAHASEYKDSRAELTVYDIGSGRFEFDMTLEGTDYEFRWFDTVFRVEGGGECFELERFGEKLAVAPCGELTEAYVEAL